MKKFTLAHLIKQQEIFTLEDPLTFIAEEDNVQISRLAGFQENQYYFRTNKNDEYILTDELNQTLNKGEYIQLFYNYGTTFNAFTISRKSKNRR